MANERATTERSRILVVDDDHAHLESLEAILSDEFEVRSATSAMTAERLLAAQAFDVVITDYQMPRLSGLALAQRINQSWPEVVVIVLTGHAEEAAVREAQRENRVFETLPKSVDPEVLLRWVRNASRAAQLRKATSRLPKRRLTGGNPPAK